MELFTEEEFQKTKSREQLNLQCDICKNEYRVLKKSYYTTRRRGCKHCCSRKCITKARNLATNRQPLQSVVCTQCGKTSKKRSVCEIQKSKKHFCSHSCNATYYNAHKKYGTRRSKLEAWLEKQLPALYPDLKFKFNSKEEINSELDIYIPSLKLAFELNGIFHYEPIYGQDKLDQIQNNDERKFQACFEKEISLCIIDTSSQKYFKESSSKKFLKIISDIINKTS